MAKISPAEDIVDLKAYSIEEAKQKVAQDKKMKSAEQKKMDERRIIRKLRIEFEQLLAEVISICNTFSFRLSLYFQIL